jgi:hypothetical protein
VSIITLNFPMKKILATLLILAPLSVGATTSEETGQVRADVEVGVEVRGKSDDHRQNNATVTDEATPEKDRKDKSENASSSAKVTGQANAEAHRSSVATFVKSLLSVADRDGGIGAEVRAVAQSQQESASTTVEAMTKIETRSKVLDFLFGTDWKNLGAVRSAAAKSAADIERLEAALADAASASVRADLEAQIEVLKDEQEDLEVFVTEHESSFSLFGWFTKLFVQADA